MHVIIAKLTESSSEKTHITEDEVFANNVDKFPDGVIEHHGDDFESIVDELCKAFGHALHASGTVDVDGKKVHWIDLDVNRAKELFDGCWNEFHSAAKQLAGVTESGFTYGTFEVESAVQRLKEAYNFDWMYVLDEYGGTTPVSSWLRALRRETKYHGYGAIRRFFVHATYDGDQ